MLATVLALLSSKLITFAVGALSGWISKVVHNWMLKSAAEADNQKAIDDASKNNSTGGLFK